MTTHIKKQEKSDRSKAAITDLSFNLPIGNITTKVIIIVLLFVSASLVYYYISFANSVNQEYGFPIDDPWIHLTFAKNLAEYGSFSYFKNEIVTSGSTSPLYTFILAIGFLITKNEMLLSYLTGILFFILSILFFYRLSKNVFPKENWLALAAVIIFVCDKWLNLIAASGMETTMYIFVLVSCFYYYYKRNPLLFAVTLGLLIWCRPDALTFILAVVIDYALFIYLKKKNSKANIEIEPFSKNDLKKIAIIFSVLVAAYVGFNLILSGSILPNTYSAKLTYYSPEYRSRESFLKFEVWNYFTNSAYRLMIIPFFISIINILINTVQGKYNKFFLPSIFIFALIFIYWYKMPYAHRFGRYLMPILPFYILLFSSGVRTFFKFLYKYIYNKNIINSLSVLFIFIVILWTIIAYNQNKELYQEQSKYISARQVSAAKWLRDNTPEGSIIATHDVGAIGYYSGRKIIDVFGLINPEYTSKIFDRNFSTLLVEDMKKQNINFTAFIREYIQVVNENPLFIGGEDNSEIMEINKFDPNKTHILSMEVNSNLYKGKQLLMQGAYQQSAKIFSNIALKDPLSSYTYFLLASAQTSMKDFMNAEKSLKKAVEIFPDYHKAVYSLVELYKKQARMSEAKEVGEIYLKNNPSDTLVSKSISKISDTTRTK